jgi:NADPH-dependent 2,4-dienoyl-CoA reductase/sulfur reductase-like enzyme
LPAWLRSACGPGDAAAIVAVRRPPAGDVAVIAPVNVLDALIGDLAGEMARWTASCVPGCC